MSVHSPLRVVGQREVLPSANRWVDSSSSNINIVVVVSRRCGTVERNILVVSKGQENVFLVADTIESFGTLNVGPNIPTLRLRDSDSRDAASQRGHKGNNGRDLHRGVRFAIFRQECDAESPRFKEYVYADETM